MNYPKKSKWSEQKLSIFSKKEQLSKINKRIDELKTKWSFVE
ncbi:MAG: hypothetical protein OEL81_05905 [Nitrosopumilus sp.]|nr:hypothetical protein [Nitrosopumilus sp.]